MNIMGERKKIIAKLAVMEKILQCHEMNVERHKKYFVHLVHDHRIVLLATLLPAFLWGWKKGRQKGLRKIIKQLMRVGVLTTFSHLKKQLSHQL